MKTGIIIFQTLVIGFLYSHLVDAWDAHTILANMAIEANVNLQNCVMRSFE